MLTSTEGIVFRQIKTASERRMVSIFTQKYGKISAGTNLNERKGRSKAALIIRPFTYGVYELYSTRNSFNLNGGDVIKSFYELSSDIDTFVNASFVLELTDKVLPDNAPQPKLFSILIDFLSALEKSEKASIDTLVIAYMLKLLSELGVKPSISVCSSCGSGIPAYFSIPDGGMVCKECAEKTASHLQAAERASLIYKPVFDTIKTIGYFYDNPISEFTRVALLDDVARQMKKMIREYIRFHLGVDRLKSESML
jgi:DNA repair protein RecO (recombination protein O)